MGDDVYRYRYRYRYRYLYLNFNEIAEYKDQANTIKIPVVAA